MSGVNKYPSAPGGAPMVEVVGTAVPGQQPAPAAAEKMSIPADFIRLGCLACSCSNMDWPSCFGCRASGTFLCYEGYFSECKIIDSPDACCLCFGGNMECVMPRTCCKCYEQIFCWECFISLPPTEEDFKAAPVGMVDVPGSALLENVIVASGGCCVISSLNCGMPGCILDGCYGKGEQLCCGYESIRYRWMCWDEQKPNPDTLCMLYKGQCYLQYPKTCCKSIDHGPCFDTRSACPCDDDVPCVYTFFPCCVCCVNGTCQTGCCVTLEQVKYQAKYRGMPPPAGAPQTAQPGAPAAQRV